MTIFERLDFLAKGNRVNYVHKGKENKKVTALQNFLSEYMEREREYERAEREIRMLQGELN